MNKEKKDKIKGSSKENDKKLKISGSLDDVLKVSVPKKKKN